MNDIEKELKETVVDMTVDASLSLDEADERYNKSINNNLEESIRKKHDSKAKTYYGQIIETLFKSNIIYSDFQHIDYFTQPSTGPIIQKDGTSVIVPGIGTKEWHDALKGEANWNPNDNQHTNWIRASKMNIIKDPKEILKAIRLFIPGDARNNINNAPQYDFNINSRDLDFRSLNANPSGHDLYALYQLLPSDSKNSLNVELFASVDEEEQYAIWALLFGDEDILSLDSSGRTVLNIEYMEHLNENKEAFVKHRYDSMDTTTEIVQENTDFLKDLSHKIVDINKYNFTEVTIDDIKGLDFEEINKIQYFRNLNLESKYYMSKLFSKNEIITLIYFLNKMIQDSIFQTEYKEYINEVIFIKHFCLDNNIIRIFDTKQFERILGLYRNLKSFQAFDRNSKKLSDYPAFSTPEKKAQIIKEFKEDQITQKELSKDKAEINKDLNALTPDNQKPEEEKIDEFTERRFSYLRKLTKNEKIQRMQELEEDIKSSKEILKDAGVSGEEKTELHNDIKYDKEVISYLEKISEEKVATLENYIVLNDKNPIGYTYDILSCISMLVHRENSAILAHIESTSEKNDVDLKRMQEILDLKDDKIINIELFTGDKTNEYNLGLIMNILDNKKIPYNVKPSFIDIYGRGSIGFNYKENQYFQVEDMQDDDNLKR